ncbi:MAG: LysM peptidoglycan-binding domain-containing protein [Bacteroidetes bacterium]|nr:MAG: LysM peptidoglycan-binding domain-containing protein [Bacteroidota bacterium]
MSERHRGRGRLLIGLMLLGAAVAGLSAPCAVRAQEPPRAEVHVVRPGETLYRIARNNGLTVDELKRLNGLTSNHIEVGQRLIIRPAPPETPAAEVPPAPTPSDPARAQPPAPPPAETATPPADDGGEARPEPPAFGRYVVRPGDTYLTIAARYGLPSDSLWLLNDRSTAPLEPGQEVRLPARFATVTYRVRRGDTLARIARAYGTSIAAIRRLNDLRGDQIRVDQVLQVPVGEPPPVQDDAGLPPVAARGAVTIYPDTFAGRLMANGEPYDPERYTVSHPSLPLGTLVYLTHPATGRSTLAEVTDRGPLDAAFIMDVSAAVARHLRLKEGDRVQVRVLGR